ncbi:MAG: SusC/RagA family TonB-linked outer membrane protein [Dysgonamonadaceae bacterium]|jgi:TonB-linked SusC/RagA family outer membrane protein|nr:SusC/RagA family TonB-linked outer membrane protein [Dysgonamonadaceae bacterium]
MKEYKFKKDRGDSCSPKCNLLRKACEIKKALALFFIFMSCLSLGNVYSQEIKGRVVDSQGDALIGASVKVVDGKEKVGSLSLGTVTDINGQYTLRIPNSNFSLEFSYIGYTPVVIPASNLSALAQVVLKEDANELAEVVVTGMTKIDKRLFTGASDRLLADDVRLTGVSELGRSLEGRAAGVTVQNVSGVFGAGPRIKVRGATSIKGDSKPLWVVDGVIIEDIKEVNDVDLTSGDVSTLISSAIAGLNASDIESFDVLKDGSATSIYGARAMAGVFVVTTKKGKKGTSRINYTGEFTSRAIPSYDEFNIMNSQDQMGIYLELEDKGWLRFTNRLNTREAGIYGKMYEMINTYNPTTGSFLMENSDIAKNAYLRQAELRNTDWFDELFSTAIDQVHSISISGGTDKTDYYGSLSAKIDPGWMMQSQVKRYTMNTNITHKILDNLSISINPRAYYINQNAPGTEKRVTNSVFSEVSRDFELNPYSYALNTARTLDPNEYYRHNWAPFNLKEELKKNYIERNETNFNFQSELKYSPIRGLDLKVLGAVKYAMTSLEHNIMDDSNQAQAYRMMTDQYVTRNNSFLYTDPDIQEYTDPISILPSGGIYRRTDYKMLGYDFRPSFDYTKGFNDDHLINIYGGMELNAASRQETWFYGWGRQYSMGDEPFFVYQAFKKWQQNLTPYYEVKTTRKRNLAFFGTATYSYKGKYIVNGTWRYEGSNRMGKARSARWLPTWNVSGAWNIHDEAAFELVKPILSNAKVRASYSLTADAPPGSVTNSQIVIDSRTPWRYHTALQESELYLSSPENSELTYEKKHELDLGADLGFFDNRISLVFDWWKRNMFDLIGNVTTATYGIQEANLAKMKSHGVEFTLSSRNIVSKDFRWTTNATFSKSHIEITELESDARILDYITGEGFARVGYANKALFSIPFKGLDEKGFPQVLTEKGEIGRYVYYQDRENTDFLIYEGPSEPTIVGGLGNVFSYKNLKLNLFLTYSFGNKLRLPTVFSYSYTDLDAMPKEFNNRWMMPGDELKTNVPAIPSERQYYKESDLRYAFSAYNYSDVRVADGGFIRLKDVSITYDFPKKWISTVKMDNLSLKLQATNLLLLYADKKLNGADPEFFRSGGVSYPLSRQYTLTLQLGF